MGIQFSIIYDIMTVALLVGFMFVGAKRGLAGVIVGLAAGFAAFFCASYFSAPISDYFYTTIVEQPVEEAVDSTLDSAMQEVSLAALSTLDYDEIIINGVDIEDISLDYSGTNKAVLDLSSVDLSGTGIAELDLSAFGFVNMDYSDINGKTAELSMSNVKKYGLGEVVVAHIISVQMQGTPLYRQIIAYTTNIGAALPILFGNTADSMRAGSEAAITSFILAMQDTSASVNDTVKDGIIAPMFKTAASTIVFLIIFLLVCLVLNFISKHLEFLNDIPIIGGINVFGGVIAGILQGVLAVFVLCIVVRFIVQLTGGDVMIFNEVVIEDSMLFNIFYGLEFLNLIG